MKSVTHLLDEYIDLTTPESPYNIKEELIISSTLSRSSETKSVHLKFSPLSDTQGG